MAHPVWPAPSCLEYDAGIFVALDLEELPHPGDVLDEDGSQGLSVLVNHAVRAGKRSVLGNQLKHTH